MRKIYTLLCALLASTAIWAQNPDPSTWAAGDNVIADLGMGDITPTGTWTTKSNGGSAGGQGNYGDYWKGDGAKFFFDYIDQNDGMYGDHEKGNTCMGYYADGAVIEKNPDVYQVIKIPAGYYTIRVQACYRDVGGQETKDGIAVYKAGKSKKNAWLYTEAYADQESAEAGSNPVRTFKTAVRSVFNSDTEEALCDWTPNGDSWRNDDSFTSEMKVWNAKKKIYETKTLTTWFPRSIIGASYYFAAGKYWNEYNILLEEDTWVRVGYRKTAYVKEDWLALSEWQIIYNGAISDETETEYAEKEITKELDQLEQWQTQFNEATFDGFNTSFNKAIADHMGDEYAIAKDEFEGAGNVSEKMDIIDGLQQKNLDYDELYQYLGHLSYVLQKSDKLLQKDKLDETGYTAFQNTYNQILGEINGCDAGTFDKVNAYDFCMERFNALAEARGDYLETQPVDAETGAKDFSAVINHPWFVNDEDEPTKNEDGTWSIKESTWQGAGGGEYTTKYTQDGVEYTRKDIASEVTLSKNDETVKNEWYQRINYEGKTNGCVMYYDSGLVGVADTWHASVFTSGSMDVCQNIIGLPSGYYSLKALIRSWGDGKGEYNNIFMQNSDGEVMTSPLAPVGEGWQEVTTGIIHVKDKNLLIGGQSDYTAHYTGFRLFFYGENPPVEKLLAQEIVEVEEAAADLEFIGDQKAVTALIDKCVKPYTIENFDEYRGYLNDARTYIRAAKKAYSNNKAMDTYTSLSTEYSSVGKAADIIDPAYMQAFDLGTGDTDTYEDIEPSNELANKYGDYLKIYQVACGYTDQLIKDILTTQENVLTAGVQTKEVLDAYMKQLNLPINMNKMKDLGALEGSESNPVDITAMIVNPTFELEEVDGEIQENDAWERGHRYGWDTNGENANSNEYSRGNYEVWNSAPFYFRQTLTGMPGGTYRLSCYAIYRDGRHVTPQMVLDYEADGDEVNWRNHNAEIYARTSDENDQFSYIKAIEALKGTTERTYTDVVTAYEVDDIENTLFATAVSVLGLTEDVSKYDYSEMQWKHIDKNPDTGIWSTATYDEESSSWTYTATSDNDPYPFDEEVVVDGTTYYFPGSMYGFYMCCMDPVQKAKMLNTVTITIQKGETLEFGLRKRVPKIEGDWVIFDDFKLEYLSGDALQDAITGIEDVVTEKDVKNNVRYNVAGQIVDESYKGIVIMSDGKKVLQ